VHRKSLFDLCQHRASCDRRSIAAAEYLYAGASPPRLVGARAGTGRSGETGPVISGPRSARRLTAISFPGRVVFACQPASRCVSIQGAAICDYAEAIDEGCAFLSCAGSSIRLPNGGFGARASACLGDILSSSFGRSFLGLARDRGCLRVACRQSCEKWVIGRERTLRLVEQGKLSLQAPVPDIDPVIAAPQLLDGFDAAGKPLLRPARRPISWSAGDD
jgi:hypothetical protein